MSKKNKVIIIDDSSMDLELAVEAFHEYDIEQELITLTDSEEALKYFETNREKLKQNNDIIFILLDLKMPKVNGLEILKKLKDDEYLKAIPILILTSSKEEKDLIECYRNGANACILKPISFSDFSGKIAAIANFWIAVNEPLPKLDI